MVFVLNNVIILLIGTNPWTAADYVSLIQVGRIIRDGANYNANQDGTNTEITSSATKTGDTLNVHGEVVAADYFAPTSDTEYVTCIFTVSNGAEQDFSADFPRADVLNNGWAMQKYDKNAAAADGVADKASNSFQKFSIASILAALLLNNL